MSMEKMEFGFYPDPLEVDAGPVRIRTLANLDAIVGAAVASEEIEDDWKYAPARRVRDLVSGETRTSPYSKRVFDLPRTHTIEHAAADGKEHLEFHV